MIGRIIINVFSRTEPEIPVEFFWNCKFSCWRWKTLWPDRAVSPNLNRMHITDHSCVMHFLCLANTIAGSTLVAHLGYNLIFFNSFGHQPRFVNIMSEWLLAVNMLTQAHG